MKAKTKIKRSYILRSKLTLVAVIFGASGMVLTAQVYAGVTTRRQAVVHPVAVVDSPQPAKPSATPTSPATAAPTPKPTTPPTTTPRPAARRVATAPKTLPTVQPAPDSSVNNLVPVAPGASPTPTPSDTPAPGRGQAGGSTPAPAQITYTSSNWSGYLSPEHNVTAASGSWTMPTPTGNGTSTSADTAWVGIGGVTSGDLIQTGTTDFVTRSGRVITQAFYELLPDASITISTVTVAPGDVMTADIHQLSGDQWLITLTNTTNGQTFTKTVTYASSESSAEWIEEDPSFSSGALFPFDHFGTVTFTDAQAASGGVTQTMTAAGAQAVLLMGSDGQPLATPSVIGSDGQSFSVTGS